MRYCAAMDPRQILLDDLRQRHPKANANVLAAMAQVPRDRFVPSPNMRMAWEDEALPIGYGQTISQPQVVLAMTDALDLRPGMRVLEVGAGSGYQAAVLAACGAVVVGVERKFPLAVRAASTLRQLGISNVTILWGDGTLGWPATAPYDAIVVAAAGISIPPPLWDQLKPGGRLVAPLGGLENQRLVVATRQPDGSAITRVLFPCRFVPLIGAHGHPVDHDELPGWQHPPEGER